MACLGIRVLCRFPACGTSRTRSPSRGHSMTDCRNNADRRYAVCRGAWSGKTVALFNTWMAPDTNPERILKLPSPDGQKVIQVRGFHVRLLMDGKRYWTPFGNMHDAEVGWAPDSNRLFVTEKASPGVRPVAHASLRRDPYWFGRGSWSDSKREARPDFQKIKGAPLPSWVAIARSVPCGPLLNTAQMMWWDPGG